MKDKQIDSITKELGSETKLKTDLKCSFNGLAAKTSIDLSKICEKNTNIMTKRRHSR